MRNLAYVKNFRELVVYQKSRELSREIFTVSKAFPREEVYSLTDQIRRSSRSIGAQIAEAWGKRSYEKHFLSKLTDAEAEQQETQHWIEIANDCNYVTPEQMNRLIHKSMEIGRLLGGMMSKSKQFCKPEGENNETLRPFSTA